MENFSNFSRSCKNSSEIMLHVEWGCAIVQDGAWGRHASYVSASRNLYIYICGCKKYTNVFTCFGRLKDFVLGNLSRLMLVIFFPTTSRRLEKSPTFIFRKLGKYGNFNTCWELLMNASRLVYNLIYGRRFFNSL